MTDANSSTIKICTRCKVEQDQANFNNDRLRADGKFPQCRSCVKEQARIRYAANKETYSSKAKAHYQKNKRAYLERAAKWADENKAKRGEIVKRYVVNNPDKRYETQRQNRLSNPGLYAAHFKMRQQRKRRAMPAWADQSAIRAIYDRCAEIVKETGIPHDVDHFYPLKNDRVCGLHNEYNLRIVTAFENRSKGNRFPTEG